MDGRHLQTVELFGDPIIKPEPIDVIVGDCFASAISTFSSCVEQSMTVYMGAMGSTPKPDEKMMQVA